jgi:GTP-binding protein EngB required for normal cell division
VFGRADATERLRLVDMPGYGSPRRQEGGNWSQLMRDI